MRPRNREEEESKESSYERRGGGDRGDRGERGDPSLFSESRKRDRNPPSSSTLLEVLPSSVEVPPSSTLPSSPTDEEYAEAVRNVLPSFYRGYFFTAPISPTPNLLADMQQLKPKALHAFKAYLPAVTLVDPLAFMWSKHPVLDSTLNLSSHVMAHGIEEAKGGLKNLISIWLTGKLTLASQFGPLKYDNPSTTSGSHGPYWIVHNRDDQDVPSTEGLSLADFECYLVPDEAAREQLRVFVGVVSNDFGVCSEMRQSLQNELAKVLTLDEFQAELEAAPSLRG